LRLLLFAGLRGERAALEAILQSAARWGECEPVCLGDAVGGGDEAGTLALMRRKGVLLVAGPADRALAKQPGALPASEVAYLRAASAPRRLVAGGKQFLLTWDPAATDPRAFVVRPGPETPVDERGATLAQVASSRGEAACLLLDLESGARETRIVSWDAPIRHVE